MGVKKRTIDKWLGADNNKPNVIDFQKVCEALGVSVEAIIKGDGEGKEGEPTVAAAHRLQGNKIIPFSYSNDDEGEIVSIPFYSEVEAAAGGGKEAEDFPLQTPLPIFRDLLTPYKPSQVKAVKVSGDSMIDIYINDKDIVLYVPSETYGDGVYVISGETGLRVKRLEFSTTGKKLTIHSENPRYKDEEFVGKEINQIRIIGKVIGWIHRHFS